MPRTRAGGAVPRNRAHGARRLPRVRWPRLVSRSPGGGRVRRAERPRADPAAGHHSRSGHELLLPQGGARRRVRLRRADPGSGPHRLAPADGTGADGRRGDPPRGTGPAAGGGGRVKVVILFDPGAEDWTRSEEHTSELQSRLHLVCRLLLEKKKAPNDSSYSASGPGAAPASGPSGAG